MATLTTTDLLTDDMLARFDERAPVYDRENRFFDEDFEELQGIGLPAVHRARPSSAAPGLGLDEYVKLVRRLAYVAPGHRAGHQHALLLDGRGRRPAAAAATTRAGAMLEKAAEGEIFCALHGEAGNDLPLLLAVATADRVDGGWEISGHKIFGSLSPVWTYGGFHAMDTSDPRAPADRPRLPAPRRPGLQIIDTWDTLGMRATQSQDTVLDKAFVPDELVRAGVPGRVRRRRPVPGRDLRLGADGLRRHLPRRGQAGVRHHRRDDAEAHVDRA